MSKEIPSSMSGKPAKLPTQLTEIIKPLPSSKYIDADDTLIPWDQAITPTTSLVYSTVFPPTYSINPNMTDVCPSPPHLDYMFPQQEELITGSSGDSFPANSSYPKKTSPAENHYLQKTGTAATQTSEIKWPQLIDEEKYNEIFGAQKQ